MFERSERDAPNSLIGLLLIKLVSFLEQKGIQIPQQFGARALNKPLTLSTLILLGKFLLACLWWYPPPFGAVKLSGEGATLLGL